MIDSNVRPPLVPLTEEDAREILAARLLKLCSTLGPTRVGKTIGVDEKTVRNARDEVSTLGLDSAANLLLLDPCAFDGFLARVGRRSVPIDAACDSDALPALTGVVHKLAVASVAASPGGAEFTREELVDAEADIRAAYERLSVLLTRIESMKRGLAA